MCVCICMCMFLLYGSTSWGRRSPTIWINWEQMPFGEWNIRIGGFFLNKGPVLINHCAYIEIGENDYF